MIYLEGLFLCLNLMPIAEYCYVFPDNSHISRFNIISFEQIYYALAELAPHENGEFTP